MKRSLRVVAIVVLCIILWSACGPPPEVHIAPVEHPVDQLPDLPSRTSTTVWSQAQVMAEVERLKTTIEELAGQIDIGTNTYLDCQEFFVFYQDTAALPEFEAPTTTDSLTQWAAEEYNDAVAHVLDTSHDLYQTCSAALMGQAKNEPVPFQRWGLARQGAADALDTFETIIYRIEEESFDASCEVITTPLEAMRCTRKQMERLGGELDIARNSGWISCQATVDLYDSVVAAPTFDVSGYDEVTQWAYGEYREAVDLVAEGAWDTANNCRLWLLDTSVEGVVPPQQWTLARMRIKEATDKLVTAIERMEEEGY